MFFKKKREELGDQFAVYQEREMPRFAAKGGCAGGITIEGFEGEGLVKNISASGCCLESVTYAAITPNQTYQARISPGPEINLDPFTLRLTVSWTKSSEMAFEAGFALEKDEKDPRLERYVEQLQTRGVEPEYGNMGCGRR
jgi:hypothetical protein